MKRQTLLTVAAIVILLFLLSGYWNRGSTVDTRIMKHVTSYDPLETIEEPIQGDAKKILEILESKTEPIEVNETYFGGLWITIEDTSHTSVVYTIFSDKMEKSMRDSQGEEYEHFWYKFSEKDYERIQALIEKLPKKKD